MKTAIIFLLIGAILGAFGWRYFERAQNPTLEQRAGKLASEAGQSVRGAQEKVADKAEDWKLTPQNIEDELAKTGRVVRSKARIVGESIDDARIIAVIKGKYVVDDKLSALAITVDCENGDVVLKGSVATPESIGRAVTLALETNGVHNVVSQLVIKD